MGTLFNDFLSPRTESPGERRRKREEERRRQRMTRPGGMFGSFFDAPKPEPPPEQDWRSAAMPAEELEIEGAGAFEGLKTGVERAGRSVAAGFPQAAAYGARAAQFASEIWPPNVLARGMIKAAGVKERERGPGLEEGISRIEEYGRSVAPQTPPVSRLQGYAETALQSAPTSLGQMAVMAASPPLGIASLVAGEGAQAAKTARELGAGRLGQAAIGLGVGLPSAALEKVGLDALLGRFSRMAGKGAVREGIMHVLSVLGVEPATEAAQEVIAGLGEMAAGGDVSYEEMKGRMQTAAASAAMMAPIIGGAGRAIQQRQKQQIDVEVKSEVKKQLVAGSGATTEQRADYLWASQPDVEFYYRGDRPGVAEGEGIYLTAQPETASTYAGGEGAVVSRYAVAPGKLLDLRAEGANDTIGTVLPLLEEAGFTRDDFQDLNEAMAAAGRITPTIGAETELGDLAALSLGIGGQQEFDMEGESTYHLFRDEALPLIQEKLQGLGYEGIKFDEGNQDNLFVFDREAGTRPIPFGFTPTEQEAAQAGRALPDPDPEVEKMALEMAGTGRFTLKEQDEYERAESDAYGWDLPRAGLEKALQPVVPLAKQGDLADWVNLKELQDAESIDAYVDKELDNQTYSARDIRLGPDRPGSSRENLAMEFPLLGVVVPLTEQTHLHAIEQARDAIRASVMGSLQDVAERNQIDVSPPNPPAAKATWALEDARVEAREVLGLSAAPLASPPPPPPPTPPPAPPSNFREKYFAKRPEAEVVPLKERMQRGVDKYFTDHWINAEDSPVRMVRRAVKKDLRAQGMASSGARKAANQLAEHVGDLVKMGRSQSDVALNPLFHQTRVLTGTGAELVRQGHELLGEDLAIDPDASFAYTGESLSEVFDGLNDDDAQLFEEYAVAARHINLAQRAATGDELEIAPGATADSTARVAELDASRPDFANRLERFSAWSRKARLDPLLENGMITPRQYADIAKKNPVHIPFLRADQLEDADAFIAALTEDAAPRAARDPKLRQITRGLDQEAKIDEKPLENALEQSIAAQRFAITQRINNTLAEIADQYPSLAAELRPAPEGLKGAADTIAVYRDGKRQTWQAPEDLSTALAGIGNQQIPKILKIAAPFAKILRATATLVPNFVARNIVRDPQSAFIFDPTTRARDLLPNLGKLAEGVKGVFQGGPGGRTSAAVDVAAEVAGALPAALGAPQIAPIMKPLVQSAGGLVDVLTGGRYSEEAMANGVAQSALVAGDRPTPQTLLADVLKAEQTKDDHAAVSYLNRWIREVKAGKPYAVPYRTIMFGLQELSTSAEMATRTSVYRRGIEAGLTELEATRGAKEASLDFSQGGKLGRQWNSVQAFFNASIQDPVKLAKALRVAPYETITKAFATITIPSVLNWLMWHDDEDYQAMAEWRKVGFYTVGKSEDGGFYHIPRPLGTMNLIFGYLPEKILDYASRKDPQVVPDLIREFEHRPVERGVEGGDGTESLFQDIERHLDPRFGGAVAWLGGSRDPDFGGSLRPCDKRRPAGRKAKGNDET